MHIIDDYDISDLPRNRRVLDIRKKKGKFDHAKFIAWDGEGITSDTGSHTYILFKSSDGTTIVNPNGIPTRDALSALCASARRNPHAIHVGYYLSYDFNMILKDLPIEALNRIRKGKRAYYENYVLRVRFGKELWVKNKATGISVTLWDVGSFFQQSFISALKEWRIDISYLDNIEAQKQRRSIFSIDDLTTIDTYCSQELEALVLLMQALHKALNTCNLRISKWHGPGAIATYLNRQHGIKRHMVVPPETINHAAQCAYGGGRIELIRQGHHNGYVYYYDIRSAYPYGISQLPSLANGRWELSTDTDPEPRELSLYHIVDWSFCDMDTFYPLRYRHPTGDINYPERGAGVWVWTPEYNLLRERYGGRYQCDKSYLYHNPNPELRPYAWVEHLYDTRQQWKAAGNAAEKGLKLGLNSLYGKMIQQVGWKLTNDGRIRLPASHQLEWGGYVTSICRAMLYRAASTNPNAIVGFETDGIISTERLSIELSNGLGSWECETYDGITYVQNGFYWLRKGDTTIKSKFRGFDKGTVTEEMMLTAWANGDDYVEATLTRHLGLHAALHQNKLNRWGDWITEPRKLSTLVPLTKRIPRCDRGNCTACVKGYGKHQALHDTDAYGWGNGESAPYPLEWKAPLPQWKLDIDQFNLNEECDYDAMDMA